MIYFKRIIIFIKRHESIFLFGLFLLSQLLFWFCFYLYFMKEDKHYEYRGFMLDCSRQFFNISLIYQILDVMHESQFNYFHWHLSDNERFSYLSKFDNGKLALSESDDPKYYTYSDVKNVINYANNLNISVIPEFELIGHAKIWNNVYPKLIHTEFNDEFNMSNPDTYFILDLMINEIIKVFNVTSQSYYHFAHDEISQPNTEILKSLQFITKYNVKKIFWDDLITQNNIDLTEFFNVDEYIIQCWHSKQCSKINKKHNIIVSDMDYWYIGGAHIDKLNKYNMLTDSNIYGYELVWFTNKSDDNTNISWIFPYIKQAGLKMQNNFQDYTLSNYTYLSLLN